LAPNLSCYMFDANEWVQGLVNQEELVVR